MMKSWMLAALQASSSSVRWHPAARKQIGADGVMEQVRFLRHHADLVGERSQGDIVQVDPIDADDPAGWIVQAGDQVGQGGFTRAAWANQRDQLAGLGGGR